MTMYAIKAEHVRPSEMQRIKDFAKKAKVKITKIEMDDLFTHYVHVRVSGKTIRDANKVRDFIWDNVNNGASCSVEKC